MRSPSPEGPLAALVLGLLLIASAQPASAVLIHVNGASGSCSSTGPGTLAQPYCTISAAAAAHHASSDTILVHPATYREQITVPGSGNPGDPLAFLATGAGVVIDGADDFSGQSKWTVLSGSVFRAAGVTWGPLQVFMDGARLSPSTAAPASLPAKSFRWVSGEGLYVNAGGGNPGSRKLLIGRRSNGFNLFAKSWVTIDGFEVTRTESRAIQLQTGCSDIDIARNRVTFANSYGIQAIGAVRIVIEQNIISDCNLHGIGLTSGTSDCTVRDNESFRNADPAARRANGIHVNASSNNAVCGNRLHDNQDSGLQFTAGANDCISFNNRSWKNGDHGFDHLGAAGTTHLHDVAYLNYKDGFSFEGNSPNIRMYNCIAVENGLTTSEYDLWVNDSSAVGLSSDFNIIWNSTPQQPIKFIATKYNTIANYRAVSGQELHSTQADPRFTNAAGGDFRLLAGSPAIDAATSDLGGWPATDAAGHARVDDPATGNTGAGTVRFADRGALEFVTNQAPIVSATASVSVMAGDTLTMPVSASDPDGDAITSLVASGLPLGATFEVGNGNTSGTLRWAPTLADAGLHVVRFAATNAFTGVDSTGITVAATTGVPGGNPTGRGLSPRVVPNPLRAQGQLRFAMARDGAARVELFDLTGRMVSRLMDEAHAPAGEYELPLDGAIASLPPGLYFYRIQTSEAAARGRFLVLR
jgi:hypothetical protein